MDNWTRQLDDPREPTRKRIVLALKVLGEASAADLGARLYLTPMGIRRHLRVLQQEGLVTYRVVRQGQGRPRHLYSLTSEADVLFAQRYASLNVELLQYLAEEQGLEAVGRLFERRAQRRVEEATRVLAHLPLEEKVIRLADILDRDGYLAEWREEDGSYLICEHNCAIRQVAETFPQACSSELAFIRAVLPEAEVNRVHHIVSGDTRCAYRVRPREEDDD